MVTLPGWVGVGEPRGRLGGLYAKNVTICPTLACTTPPHGLGKVRSTHTVAVAIQPAEQISVPVIRVFKRKWTGLKPRIDEGILAGSSASK